MRRRSPTLLDSTHLVTKPHHSARRRDGNETARHEALDSGLLGSLCERDLLELVGGTDGADDDIDVLEGLEELFLRCGHVTLADLDTSLLEGGQGRLGRRSRSNESIDFL